MITRERETEGHTSMRSREQQGRMILCYSTEKGICTLVRVYLSCHWLILYVFFLF